MAVQTGYTYSSGDTARQTLVTCAAMWTQDREQVQEMWKLCMRRTFSEACVLLVYHLPSAGANGFTHTVMPLRRYMYTGNAQLKTILLYCTVVGRCRDHLGALSSPWHSWKPRMWRRNFDAIHHSSRDISTSGLGGHVAISRCRLLSQSFENTFLNSLWSESYTLWVQLHNTYSGSDL